MDWQRTPSINRFDWPTDFVLKRAAENKYASDARRRALIIRGKDIREYTTVLQDSVRRSGGYVLNGPDDAASLILGGAGEFQNYDLKRIFDPISQKSAAKLNQSIDSLGFASSADQISDVFSGDRTLGNRSTLRSYFNACSKSASNKVILYFPMRHIIRNFDALVAQTIAACSGSYWIFAGEMNELSHYGVESLERPYLGIPQLTTFFSSALGVAADDVASMIASTRPITAFDADRMTIRDFNEAVRYYWRSAERYAFPAGPSVPKPSRAPLQFKADLAGISVTPPVDAEDGFESVPAAAEEVLESLRDVKNHHGISNAAPALSSKLERIEGHLVAMLNGAEDSSVIRLGISTQAAHEQLKYEGENISASSLGAVSAALSAVSLLLQRVHAWREYLEGESLFASDPNQAASDRAEIFAVLTDLISTPSLLDKRSEAAVIRYRTDLNSPDSTAAEQSGLIRVGQNLVSVIARFLRGVLSRASVSVVDGIYELPKSGVTALMITFLLRNAPSWQHLAERYPLIFGWVGAFVNWLTSLTAS